MSLLKPRHAFLLASLIFIPAVHASSFDCASAGSPTEKAICSDPYLSSLDEKLGGLWPQTLAKVADPKALKTDQRQWLKNRNGCAQQLACLRREYLMRIAELEYAATPFSWDATWQLIPGSPATASEITTRRRDAGHITFDISAQNGGNSGDLTGVAVLKGAQADYAEGQCALSFAAINGILNVTQDGADADCGGGMGVFYAGRYVISDQPVKLDYDLLSLGLARTLEEDQTLRALLKADYQTLVDTSGSMMDGDSSHDVPDSQVGEIWMRGLGGTALFMSTPDSRFWVMLMAYDGQGNTRVRYYTNAAQWKTRLPDVMQAWHQRMANGQPLPLDFMP
ncbi:lysozyme inhibitor LprI family protein [Pseudomonas sp. Eth.TT006]